MCETEQMEVAVHGWLSLNSRPLDRGTFRRADLRLIQNGVPGYLNLIASGMVIASSTRRISSKNFQLDIVHPL